MSKQCDIVRDILPLYVDGACSEASAEMVKEHLNACADCNVIYQKLLSHTSEDVLHEESESVIMRHEAKEKQRGRKKITIAVLVSIALCIIAIFTALFLLPINIAYEPVKIDFPFEVEDVESVEMYHYDEVPASAEKKVVVAENDIKTLYDKFKGLSLKDKTTEETAGAAVTSFRFNLSDGTSYDLIYACYGVKNGELKSAAGGFKYFTSADIGQDERRKSAAVDSPARLCCSVIKRATAQDAAALCHYSERGIFHDRTRKVSRTYPAYTRCLLQDCYSPRCHRRSPEHTEPPQAGNLT